MDPGLRHPPSDPLDARAYCTLCGADPLDPIHWPPVDLNLHDRLQVLVTEATSPDRFGNVNRDAVAQLRAAIHDALR